MINEENERENKKIRTKSRRRTTKKEILRKEIVTNEESDSDDLSEVSFSISKPSDVDSLCENISNKSKDDMKFDYENTLKTAENDLMEDVDSQLKKLSLKEKGFDKDIKLLSSNLYKSISQSVSGLKSPNNNQHNLDKTVKGMTNFGSISEAMDDQTMRLKNDLSGEPMMIGPEFTEITDIKFSKASSIKGKEKLAYKKTLSLEYSKDKENSKKEIISSSSRNKNSIKGMESSSKNILTEDHKE
jgi:hypothetical protein